MESMGRVILSIGLFLVVIGLLITFGSKIGIGRLPGDIFFEKGNFKFFFPNYYFYNIIYCSIIAA